MSKLSETIKLNADERRARRIHDYWAERGHAVETLVVSVGGSRYAVLGVRSDMIDGLPRSARRQDSKP